MKKILRFILLFVLCLCFLGFPSDTYAYQSSEVSKTIDKIGDVIIGGDTIGLRIKTNVTIVGKYNVLTNNGNIEPWKNSDIRDGDIIYSANNYLVKSNDDFNQLIKNLKTDKLSLVLIRDDEMINTYIDVVQNEKGLNSIGLYIKDHITGIGTLTFINPKTNKFASLGHNVSDSSNEGSIYESSIKGIKKGTRGVPGEKYAILGNNEIGIICKNCNVGVFGDYAKTSNNEVVPLIKASSVKKGKAQIATVINGNEIKYYDIEIEEVDKQKETDIKGIKFKIVDQELIEITGGVIQGMSGSPIIQNGCLVGAVSHVIVNDPSLGYGVFAEWMYYNTLN